jgi:hypothetical protein
MFVHFSGVVIMIDEWAPFTVWLLVYFVYLFAKKAFISFSIQVPFDLVNNNLSFYTTSMVALANESASAVG